MKRFTVCSRCGLVALSTRGWLKNTIIGIVVEITCPNCARRDEIAEAENGSHGL